MKCPFCRPLLFGGDKFCLADAWPKVELLVHKLAHSVQGEVQQHSRTAPQIYYSVSIASICRSIERQHYFVLLCRLGRHHVVRLKALAAFHWEGGHKSRASNIHNLAKRLNKVVDTFKLVLSVRNTHATSPSTAPVYNRNRRHQELETENQMSTTFSRGPQ